MINTPLIQRELISRIETYFTLIRNTKTKTIIVAFHHKQYGDGCTEFHKNSVILSANTIVFTKKFSVYIKQLFSYNLICISVS